MVDLPHNFRKLNCKLQIMDWYFIDHFTLTEYGKLPVIGPSTRKHQKNKPNYKPPRGV